MNGRDPYDADRIYHEASVIQNLRDLGAVDLTRTKRTIGFERRPLRPDERPRTGAAWGEAPHPRAED